MATAIGTKHTDACATCEGSGSNMSCSGACGRSFHDACAGATADDVASKEWRCGRCSKISVRGPALSLTADPSRQYSLPTL